MAPKLSETLLTTDRTTLWLFRCVTCLDTLFIRVLKRTDRAEEFGLSFAKLLDAVVRNAHTTADRLQLKMHSPFQEEDFGTFEAVL